MPTDDERRRVAESLRRAAEQGQPYTSPTLACFVEAERADPTSLWNRLADLIDPGEDVSMSAYDLLPEDDRDALAWVREHGGVEHVKEQDEALARRLSALAREAVADADPEDEVEALDVLERAANCRLMPEGMEWPRFDDLEPVRIGDDFMDMHGRVHTVANVRLKECGEFSLVGTDRWGQSFPAGSRVGRPGAAPKVLDADGAEIREKRDAWWICEGDERGVHAERLRVETIGLNGLVECSPYNGGTWVYLEPSELYVNEPVLAADGKPLREGETVFNETGLSFKVTAINPKNNSFEAIRDLDGSKCYLNPRAFSHERPDSYDALWEDIENCAISYSEFMRRARALAGRDAS